MATRKTTTFGFPAFVADPNSMDRVGGGIQIDWANVPESYRQTPGVTVTLTANAAQGATSLTVSALTRALAIGELLYFGEAGELARVSAATAKGATTVSVDALGTAIESGDAATINGSGPKRLPAGAALELVSASTLYKPATGAGGTTAILLATNASEDNPTDASTGYGAFTGGNVYETLLPDATGTNPRALPSGIKTALGSRFFFQPYQDVR